MSDDLVLVRLRERYGSAAVEVAGSMLAPWLVLEDEVLKRVAMRAFWSMALAVGVSRDADELAWIVETTVEAADPATEAGGGGR